VNIFGKVTDKNVGAGALSSNSHRYAGGDEFRRVAGLHAEGAAEEDIMRKNLAAADGSIDNDDNDDNQGGLVSDEDQSSSVGLQDNATAGLAESPELDSAHAEEVSVQRMGGDSCNTRNFLNLSSTNETIFDRELQSDMDMLPTSPSVQQESSFSSVVARRTNCTRHLPSCL